MKITIEIPAHCYGYDIDDQGNITVPSAPIGKRAKRERLLDRSFNEWEAFRFHAAKLVYEQLFEMTPGYLHPNMIKAKEDELRVYKQRLSQRYDF